MSLWSAYLDGLAMGVLLAIQVGPISLLCMRQAMSSGFSAGAAVGLGAATADVVYAVGAALGLGALGHLLGEIAGPMRIIGGAMLIWFGLKGWLKRTNPPAPAQLGAGAQIYLSTFLLTMTNPLTILFFAGVFASMGMAQGEIAPGMMVAAGIGTMTVVWKFSIAAAASRLAHWLTPDRLKWVNGVASLGLAAFGIAMIGRAIFG
ncbi:LysE family translocator [Lacibacterium aquatile]|uniref:LysE family translocator n=1 Tax=Lacibacterium aquatile TaxID=1168082 RepID=A0ABW5DYJ0_9PROT